ncbi:MAG: hypothetical protein Q8N51_08410, partial [Gammaproteobacteria bacterium]|nr:hypothetical protein [Gammaproteobacteria bacterium]
MQNLKHVGTTASPDPSGATLTAWIYSGDITWTIAGGSGVMIDGPQAGMALSPEISTDAFAQQTHFSDAQFPRTTQYANWPAGPGLCCEVESMLVLQQGTTAYTLRGEFLGSRVPFAPAATMSLDFVTPGIRRAFDDYGQEYLPPAAWWRWNINEDIG